MPGSSHGRRGRWCWPTTCTASTAGPTSLARCSASPFTFSRAGGRRGRGSAAPVAQILVRGGQATGVALEDGTELRAGTVLSGADPKRTFLGLVGGHEL